MGIFLHFYMNFNGISQESWEKAYQESIKCLKKFPFKLVRTIQDKHQRYTYSDSIIVSKNKSNERWCIEGDAFSLRSFEAFELYRYPNEMYFNEITKSFHKQALSKSIFCVEANHFYSTTQFSKDLWGNKTQGYPYHLALLAVGILLEQHFEGNCYLHGDFTKAQAYFLSQWLEKTFNRPFALPVCLDLPKLWKYIYSVIPDYQKAIDRLLAIKLTSEKEVYRFFATTLPTDVLLEHLTQKLNTPRLFYEKADILCAILDIWQDIDKFLDLLSKIDTTKSLNLTKIIEIILSRFTIIEPTQQQQFNAFFHHYQKTREKYDIVSDAQLFNLYLSYNSFCTENLMIMKAEASKFYQKYGSDIRPLYVSFVKLLHSFTIRQPENQEKIKNTIKKAQKRLEKLLKKTQNFTLIPNTSDIIVEEDSFVILQSAVHQRIIRSSKEVAAFGVELRSKMIEHEFSYDNREKYIKSISFFSKKNHIILSKKAWQAIDSLQDTDLLRLFCKLVSILASQYEYYELAIYILENPHCWNYFKYGKALNN